MKKLEKNKNKFPAAAVFRSTKIYKNLGKIAMRREWYETAIKIFNIAERVAKTDTEKIPLHLSKSNAHKALANLDEARYEAMKGLSIDPEGKDITPYLNLANLLFHENEFEESIAKYAKVKDSGNPEVEMGINLAMGTLENCVGKNAGTMFDDEVLGKVIRKMKQEQLGIAPPRKPLTTDEQNEREIKLNLRKRYITGRYLGQLAEQKDFLKELKSDDNKVALGSLAKPMTSIIDRALDKLDKKEHALWHRKPLYSYYNKVKNFQTSDYAKKFNAQTKQGNKKMINMNIIKQINQMREHLDKKQYELCYTKMLRLRPKLKSFSKKQLPNKVEYLREIVRIIGDMYLSTKQMIPNRSTEINDLRIKYMLGVYRPVWPAEIHSVDHVQLRNPQQLKQTFLAELNTCNDTLAKIFLNYEIVFINIMLGEFGQQNTDHILQAIVAAKKARNINWYLNSLMLMAKIEFQSRQIDTGKLVLMAAKKICKKYKKRKQRKFIGRALELLENLQPADFKRKESLLLKEKRFINSMPTDRLKNKLAELMLSLRTIPDWKKMIIPASGSVKQRLAEINQLRPFPKNRIKSDKLDFVNKSNWVAGFDDKNALIEETAAKPTKAQDKPTPVIRDYKLLKYLTF